MAIEFDAWSKFAGAQNHLLYRFPARCIVSFQISRFQVIAACLERLAALRRAKDVDDDIV